MIDKKKINQKPLAEQAEEEGFTRMANKDMADVDKTGLPTNKSEREFLNSLLYERARDAGNRAKIGVERGERTDPMGNAPYKKGGKVSSASSRADGIAQRGKTRGRMV